MLQCNTSKGFKRRPFTTLTTLNIVSQGKIILDEISSPPPHTVPAMILSGTVGFLWHYVFESETVHTIDAVRKVCTQFLFVLDGCLLFLMYGDDDFLHFHLGCHC